MLGGGSADVPNDCRALLADAPLLPGIFCAGADLKERAAMTQSEAAEFVTRIRRTFSELQVGPMGRPAERLSLGAAPVPEP